MIDPITTREIKDSGERTTFASGAVRDTDDDKSRPELIPAIILRELGYHFANGAKKYGASNWKNGQDIDRLAGSLMRHYIAWAEGETDEPHMIALIWNAIVIAWNEIMVKNGKLTDSVVGELGILAKEKREQPLSQQDLDRMIHEYTGWGVFPPNINQTIDVTGISPPGIVYSDFEKFDK